MNLLRHDDVIDVAFEVDIPLAYVIDDRNRARSVERIRNWLSTLDIHVAGRWAEWDHYNGGACLRGGPSGRRSGSLHRLVDS